MQLVGERARPGRHSVRLTPNIRGVSSHQTVEQFRALIGKTLAVLGLKARYRIAQGNARVIVSDKNQALKRRHIFTRN